MDGSVLGKISQCWGPELPVSGGGSPGCHLHAFLGLFLAYASAAVGLGEPTIRNC